MHMLSSNKYDITTGQKNMLTENHFAYITLLYSNAQRTQIRSQQLSSRYLLYAPGAQSTSLINCVQWAKQAQHTIPRDQEPKNAMNLAN